MLLKHLFFAWGRQVEVVHLRRVQCISASLRHRESTKLDPRYADKTNQHSRDVIWSNNNNNNIFPSQ